MTLSRDDRLELIKKIEQKRGSKLLVYITGDRNRLETKIGSDTIQMFQDILMNAKPANGNIDLFIYSLGGDGVAALTLVSLIREYCSHFSVIIPLKAFSAATLIALGANSILMLKSGEMGPVDVSITTPFNPCVGPNERPQFLPINVEDLYGYVNFAKKQVGLTQERQLVDILNNLTSKINPLAIGAVHRAREKNKKIAATLLEYHLKDPNTIDQIAETITTGLFEHSFIISRKDAKSLKLPVEDSDPDLERLVWDLFKAYYEILELGTSYNPEMMIDSNDMQDVVFHRAIIEHRNEDHLEIFTYQTTRKFFKTYIEDAALKITLPHILERDLDQGWYRQDGI